MSFSVFYEERWQMPIIVLEVMKQSRSHASAWRSYRITDRKCLRRFRRRPYRELPGPNLKYRVPHSKHIRTHGAQSKKVLHSCRIFSK